MNTNTTIILLLLSIGLFYTFSNGQYQAARQSHALASEYKNILRDISAIEELRDSLSAIYESMPTIEIERLNKILPDNNDTVRLTLELDSMATIHGISLKRITAETNATNNSESIILSSPDVYDKVRVSISFVSSYDDFMSFLANIERNLRIMDVRTISFSASDTGLYEYDVSLDTYWLK